MLSAEQLIELNKQRSKLESKKDMHVMVAIVSLIIVFVEAGALIHREITKNKQDKLDALFALGIVGASVTTVGTLKERKKIDKTLMQVEAKIKANRDERDRLMATILDNSRALREEVERMPISPKMDQFFEGWKKIDPSQLNDPPKEE